MKFWCCHFRFFGSGAGHFRAEIDCISKIFELINQLKKALYLYNLWINRNKPVQTYFKQK